MTRNTQHMKEEKAVIFIVLAKFRGKATKDMIAQSSKVFEQNEKEGAKLLGFYYTLGRYDSVIIIEGPDEKTAMKWFLRAGGIASTETLVAVPAEEGRKLVEQ